MLRVSAKKMGTLFPDRILVKLKFKDNVQVNNNASNAVFTYRGNNAYDPRGELGGTSSYMFAEYASIYGKYMVHASKCKFTATNYFPIVNTMTSGSATATNSNVPNIAIWPARPSDVDPDPLDIPMVKFSRWKMLTTPGGNRTSSSVKQFIGTKKILGLREPLTWPDYGAYTTGIASATNPNIAWNWKICAYDYGASQFVAIAGVVEITYYVEFFEKRSFSLTEPAVDGDQIANDELTTTRDVNLYVPP